MDTYHFNKAVALVVFNRLDCVQRQMEILKSVTPPRLYIISDGARKEVVGEDEKVKEIREYIEANFNWEGELIKIYANENMGCDVRSVTGYHEVFKKEEEAVLLEDDSIPCIDFYKYIEKMLDYYRDIPEIMMVTGFNTSSDYRENGKDYFFSYFPLKCAWATWRRAWTQFDEWKEKYRIWNDRMLYEMLPQRVANIMRVRILSNYNGWTAWDSIWDFLIFYQKRYGIISAVNYVQNMGTGREDAFHPGEYNPLFLPSYGKFSESFSYRESIKWDKEYDLKQAEIRFPVGCDKNWKKKYIRECLLRFAKSFFPKWLYNSISIMKQKDMQGD